MTEPKAEPTSRKPLVVWLRRLALVVSLLCFVWVLGPIWRSSGELADSLDGPALAGGIVLAALGYGLLCTLLAAAWWWVSGIYGRRPGKRAGYAVWAQSQIAKYLPGNFGHVVSRQVLGREAGLSHPALVASFFLEMGSLLLAAVALGGAGVLAQGTTGSLRSLLPWMLFCGVGCLFVWPVADALGRRWPRTAAWMEGLPHLGVKDTLRLLAPALVFHLAFFLATGALLVGLAASAWGRPPEGAWNLVWLYPIAWAAGAITVGAPAGVGVREAVLLLQLEGMLGPGRAAALAVALRLVTTGGDLLTGLAGWWLRKR